MNSAFRPSSINRFVKCNLWEFLPSEGKTEEQIAYLAERSKDHERLEKEEFRDSESQCRDYFLKVKSSCSPFLKEQRLSTEIEDEHLSGTPDVYGYDEKTKTLYILDYKTGRMLVKAEENQQLLAYALLILDNYPHFEPEKIELTILNTQHDQISSWSCSKKEIDILKGLIGIAIRMHRKKEVSARKGDWCFFCPAKRYCPLQRDYKHLKDYADRDTDKLILSVKARNNELKAREKEVKEGVFSKLLTPLITKRRVRCWKKDAGLPEKFYIQKPMSIIEAQERFAMDELEAFIETRHTCILKRL